MCRGIGVVCVRISDEYVHNALLEGLAPGLTTGALAAWRASTQAQVSLILLRRVPGRESILLIPLLRPAAQEFLCD